MIWDVNLIPPWANEEVNMNEGEYHDKIEAEDDNEYLGACEGMSCEEERPGVSEASWCGSQEGRLEMSSGEI